MVELSYQERVRRRLQGETASSAVERARLVEEQERQLDVREQQQRLGQLAVGGPWEQ